MNRNTVLIVLIVVCFAIAGYMFIGSDGGQPDKLSRVKKYGSPVHVMCVNEDCLYSQDDFEAHSRDRDWPKECPKCGQKTLYRAVRCEGDEGCGKYTPWHLDTKGRVYCIHCKRWLNPPPPGGGDGMSGP